jgi:hypothetical protein
MKTDTRKPPSSGVWRRLESPPSAPQADLKLTKTTN